MRAEEMAVNNEFYLELMENLKNGEELDIRQIYSLKPDSNTKTISWRIHKLVQQGKIQRTARGYYSLAKVDSQKVTPYEYLQRKSQEVYDSLVDYSFDFYITGLDSLIGEVLHVPEKYPVLLVVSEQGTENALGVLSERGMIVLSEKKGNNITNPSLKNRIDAIILKGKNFTLSTEHIAQKEKGFIDLYYAVTRMDYSLSIPELSRIYQNMQRNHTMGKDRMKKAAKDRGISTEILWLLEMGKVPEKALEFMIYHSKERKTTI